MRRCPRLAAAAARHHRPRGIATTALRPADQPGGTTELGVGELEGAKFRIEPLRRVGEDSNTMRARLICKFLFAVPVHMQSPRIVEVPLRNQFARHN